jgi:thiamine biosynthesis lipoprotein
MSAARVGGETRVMFPCFGGRCAVIAAGGPEVEERALEAQAMLGRWHDMLTRFDSLSELSLVNLSPASRVRVSPVMARFAEAAIDAARLTGGLVDPTLTGEIEAAGYTADIADPVPLTTALVLAPERAPARPDAAARWRRLDVDRRARVLTRPPGLRLDSGGIAKGLFADMAAELLAGASSFAVDCCGDLRVGGRDGLPRPVRVDDPFGRGTLHEFELADGGVATSGIGRRSWIGPDGLPAHHLLDPATGRPAYTGVVQATAIASSAARAEVLAKAALLSGPDAGRGWLEPHGGVLVFDDGSHEVVEAASP